MVYVVAITALVTTALVYPMEQAGKVNVVVFHLITQVMTVMTVLECPMGMRS